MKLKEQGIKTDPVFCTLLGLKVDLYEALLEYCRQNGFI